MSAQFCEHNRTTKWLFSCTVKKAKEERKGYPEYTAVGKCRHDASSIRNDHRAHDASDADGNDDGDTKVRGPLMVKAISLPRGRGNASSH